MSQVEKEVKQKKIDDRYYIFCMFVAPILLVLHFTGIWIFSRIMTMVLIICFIIGLIYLPQFLSKRKKGRS